MEEAIVQIAIQVPTVALTFLFCTWVIRLLMGQLVPRIDTIIDLMKEHVRGHRR